MSKQPREFDGTRAQWRALEHELTHMPIPGLDGLTRADVEREHRGAVYLAQMHLRRALESGNAQAIAHARANLAGCYRRARAERVSPYWPASR